MEAVLLGVLSGAPRFARRRLGSLAGASDPIDVRFIRFLSVGSVVFSCVFESTMRLTRRPIFGLSTGLPCFPQTKYEHFKK